jgi:hypothetical protein
MINPSLTDLYLAELRLLLPPGPGRRRLLQELRDHVVDAAEEQVERGVPPLEAEAGAISRLGPPDVVAREAGPELEARQRTAPEGGGGLLATLTERLRALLPRALPALASARA